MTGPRESWYDDAAGPLVRPFAVARGRTVGNSRDLDMITLVASARRDPSVDRMDREYAEIVRTCGSPISVAEVSSALALPLAVTKILVGDLIEGGYLNHRTPSASTSHQSLDINVLQTVIDGVRRI